MHELSPKTEILQARTGALIATMQETVDGGLDPAQIIWLEEEMPSEFRDFVMVLLGLKPAASFLHRVVDCFFQSPRPSEGRYQYPHDAYIWGFRDDERIRQLGIEIMINPGHYYAWNPQLVIEVLENNQDLVKRTGYYRSPQTLVYNERDFSQFLNTLDRYRFMALEAVLFGYPRIAGELYEKYSPSLIPAAERLWRRAKRQGVPLTNQEPPRAILYLERNICGYKDEFLVLAGKLGGVYEKIVDYIRDLRPADVPGYPYATYGDLTLAEARVRGVFAATQFDQRFSLFLSQYQ